MISFYFKVTKPFEKNLYNIKHSRRLMSDNDNLDKIKNDFYKLKFKTQDEFLKANGINVDNFRQMEKKLDNEYNGLITNLHKMRMQEGENRAENHVKTSSQLSELQKLEGVSIDAIAKFLFPIWPWKCYCWQIKTINENRGRTPDGEGILRNPTGTGTAEIDYQEDLNQTKPYISVSGGGTGSTQSVKVNTYYKFTYTPEKDGTYCIDPEVYMNGWWLLWTWGTCSGGVNDIGSGKLHVKLRVLVEQVDVTLGTTEHVIEDLTFTSGADGEGSIDYSSPDDGGSRITVPLSRGDQAIIYVECEIYGEITNYGRVIIDMKNGRNFYFKIPTVRIQKRFCPIIPLPPPPTFPQRLIPPFSQI